MSLLHTHHESIVCEFTCVDEIKLLWKWMSTAVQTLEDNCAYLVVWNNLSLPFGTTTHIRYLFIMLLM